MHIVVVGSGIAGLSAALSAAEAGAKITLVERAAEGEHGGNTRYTEAYLRMKSMDEVADDFVDHFMANAGGYTDPSIVQEMVRDHQDWSPLARAQSTVDPDLLGAFAEHAGPTLRWLEAAGLKFDFLPTAFITTTTPGTVDAHYENVTRRIYEQRGGIAWLICDAKLDDVPNWQKGSRTDQPPVTADRLEGLAQAIDIPAEALASTVAAYNAACGEGAFDPLKADGLSTSGLTPSKSNWARRIDAAPYRAWPVISANVFTFGGLKADRHARVIDLDGNPIPGLYAAGETMGIYYRTYTGSTSVLRGAVFGRQAALHAAGAAG